MSTLQNPRGNWSGLQPHHLSASGPFIGCADRVLTFLCSCGKEVCYVCGADWRTCACPFWAEARFYDVANRVVHDQVPAHEDEVVRAQVFAEALHQLRNQEVVGCEHGRRSQWRYLARPFRQCELCYRTLPEYIFECKSCRILACNRCIRNRMR